MNGDLDRVSAKIENSMKEAAADADRQLEKIGGQDVWGGVERGADRAGEHITGSMREASTQSDKHLGNLHGSLTRLAGLAATAFASIGIGQLVADSVAGARDAQAGFDKLQAVVQSTGQAAGLTAEQMAGIATDLSFKIAVDDDDIIAAETVLATYKNVAGDTFTSAIASAADLSAVFGQDLSASANMLGKALNDPTQGISALTRVGVTFTQQQKDQVKAMQAAGDIAGAQAIIMGEVKSQVSGAAEASATGAQKMSVAFGELKESLGGGISKAIEGIAPAVTKLLTILGPSIEKLSTTIGKALGPLLDALGPTFEVVINTVVSLLGNVATILGGLAPIIAPIISVLGQVATIVGGFLATAFTALQPVLLVIVNILTQAIQSVLPVVVSLFDALAPVIQLVGDILARTLAAVLPIVVQALDALMAALAPVLPALGDALMSILTALAPIIPPLVDAIINMQLALLPLLEAILPLIPPIAQLIVLLVEGLGPVLLIVANAVDKLSLIIGSLVQIIVTVLTVAVTDIGSFFQTHFKPAIDGVTSAFSFLKGVGETLAAWLSGAFSLAWATFRLVYIIPITTAVNVLKDAFQFLWDKLEPLRAFILGAFKLAVDWFVAGLKDLWTFTGNVISIIGGLLDHLRPIAEFIIGSLKASFDWFVAGLKDVWGFANNVVQILIEVYNWLTKIGDIVGNVLGKVGGALNHIGIGGIHLAVGGIVDGMTPAVIGEAGREAVIPITRPGRAMELMEQSGLGAMWERMSAGAGRGGPLFTIGHATIQDATDVELMAQRTAAAMDARLVAA